MERMMRLLYCIFFMAFFQLAHAQVLRPLSTTKIPNEVGCVSSDSYGFVYLTDVSGNIYKLDSLGKQFVMVSPPRRGKITSVEAYRNVNIFVFYSEYQVYYYYDRFLKPSQPLVFSAADVGYVRIATPSLDQNVWLVDDQDFTLKKYNSTYLKIDINTHLDLIIDPEQYDMNFMREYQNLLFVNDANSGILIFDNMGNYKTRLPVLGLTYFSFSGDDLVYIKDGSFYMINMYTYKERKYTNELFNGSTSAVLINKRLYVLSKGSLIIYAFEENKE